MEIYLVGGAVRDELLGLPVTDRDWVVVGATAEQMLALGYKQVGADFPVFLHPKTGEEYALARTERKQGKGYHGFTVYSSPDVTLEEDLLRRDLTINAMAKGRNGSIIDPFGGQRDLQHRRLHHVSEAFCEDPLRILRTARFLARFHHLEFHISQETMALMTQMAGSGEVGHLVPERVWQEIQRALHEATPTVFFTALRDCGALDDLIPELRDEVNFTNAMKALTCISEQADTTTDCRTAALLSTLDAASGPARAKALKAPNECQDMSRLVIECSPELNRRNTLTGERLLSVMERADAWRRPERLERLLTTCCCLPDGLSHQQHLRIEHALVAARKISARDLIPLGFKGKALGEALQRERLKAVEQALTETETAHKTG
ncbi:multifunctional CCA tRNA nucleotidyl transferase/2'3'-cyclic phosphodiesterase/2'nucleotidase/phosphatase [uncultured Marinobacter sp.]|uniref:multifunctional CCA tRNA nucleotidyl transferase/2'3'-cyclic phosphodiesterase/2'nucleotidase/phosphatase n=1 Tax=uncultured Marinobacter sp. TaxID=187379 RepID=UPI0030DCD0BE